MVIKWNVKKKDIYGQEKNIEEYDMYYKKINYLRDGSNRRIDPRTLTVFCVISDRMFGKNFPNSCKGLETLILTLHFFGLYQKQSKHIQIKDLDKMCFVK